MTNYEWDERKRIANQRKHDVDFADMKFFDWSTAFEKHEVVGGEHRFVAIGFIEGTLHVVCFTEPDDERCRIISLRRATTKERRLFHEW